MSSQLEIARVNQANYGLIPGAAPDPVEATRPVSRLAPGLDFDPVAGHRLVVSFPGDRPEDLAAFAPGRVAMRLYGSSKLVFGLVVMFEAPDGHRTPWASSVVSWY